MAWSAHLSKRKCGFTILIFFVTGVYAFVSYLQWDISREALDANERAWLLGTAAKLEVGPDGMLVISAAFKNFGKSPAFDVRHNVGITPVHAAPEDGDALKGGSEIQLPPGGMVEKTGGPRPDVTPEQIKLILAGRAQLFVWLRIRYRDPFTPSQRTRDTLECWCYDAKLSNLVVCSGGQYHR